MKISNHVLVGASRKHKVKTYGTLVPSYITLHYTMGGTVSSSVTHLNKYGYGYNVIIDRNGDVYQTAPFNRIVRHAGASNWRGWDNLNSFAVGISFANYGPCYLKNGVYRNEYGSKMKASDVVPGDHYNGAKKYQGIYWEKYTSPQLKSAIAITKAIIKAYQIRDVVRHDDVSIGRKIDTGPALDLKPFHALFSDRSGEKIYVHEVAVSSLDLKQSYSVNSSTIGSLVGGTKLYVHSYAYRKTSKLKWCAVSRDGFKRIGFVDSNDLKPVGNFV